MTALGADWDARMARVRAQAEVDPAELGALSRELDDYVRRAPLSAVAEAIADADPLATERAIWRQTQHYRENMRMLRERLGPDGTAFLDEVLLDVEQMAGRELPHTSPVLYAILTRLDQFRSDLTRR